MIDSGLLINSPVTREAMRSGISIWGPRVPNLKGKTTRYIPESSNVRLETNAPIPPHILQQNQYIVMCVTVMKVNKIPFMVSIGRVVKYVTCTGLHDLKTLIIVELM